MTDAMHPCCAKVGPSVPCQWCCKTRQTSIAELRLALINDYLVGIRHAAAPPLAPPHDFKRQFRLGFNNYLHSALTLRGVSSLYVIFRDKPRRGSAPHPIGGRAAAGCALGEMIRLSVSADDRDQCQV